MPGTYTLAFYENLQITAVISFIVQAPGWKGLPGKNTLAYYEHLSFTDLKSFITLVPGANVIKLFLCVVYEFFSKLECLLGYAGKACY